MTDEDSDDVQSQFFHPPGNRLSTRSYKKQVLLSFVLAIELPTVNIKLRTIDCKKGHKLNCTSEQILPYLCPRLYEEL